MYVTLELTLGKSNQRQSAKIQNILKIQRFLESCFMMQQVTFVFSRQASLQLVKQWHVHTKCRLLQKASTKTFY